MWRVPSLFLFTLWVRFYQGGIRERLRISLSGAIQHSIKLSPKVQLISLRVWPSIMCINYLFIPVALRGLYNTTTLFFWSVYMAMLTRVGQSRRIQHQPAFVEQWKIINNRSRSMKNLFQDATLDSEGHRGQAVSVDVNPGDGTESSQGTTSEGFHKNLGLRLLIMALIAMLDDFRSNSHMAIFESSRQTAAWNTQPAPLSNVWLQGLDGPARSDALTRYESVRRGCQWHASREKVQYEWWPTPKSRDGDIWDWHAGTPPAETRTGKLCIVNDDAPSEEWHIYNLGPFVSTGGEDHHRIRISDPFQLNDFHFVTGSYLAPLTAEGVALGNPPIQTLYAHMAPEQRASSNLSRIDEWRADCECNQTNGGKACRLHLLPMGYGLRHPAETRSTRLNVEANFNDIRAPHSRELHFYLEAAVRISRKKYIKDVGTLILCSPASYHWWDKVRFSGTYEAPNRYYSAIWYTARLPVSGTLVTGRLSATGSYEEAMVVSGMSPQELGLTHSPFMLLAPWAPWVPEDMGWWDGADALLSLKRQILACFHRKRRECLSRGGSTPRLQIFKRSENFSEPRRQTPWPDGARGWQFSHHDDVTIIVFHAPQCCGSIANNTGTSSYQQALTLNYLPPPGESSQYHAILSSTDARSAWLDMHSSFLCFLNAGCPAETFWRGTTMAVLITTVMIFLYLGMITCLLWSCALQPMASWCISSLVRRLMAVRLTIGWPCGKQGYGRFDDETRPKVGVRSHGIHMRRLSVDPMLAASAQCNADIALELYREEGGEGEEDDTFFDPAPVSSIESVSSVFHAGRESLGSISVPLSSRRTEAREQEGLSVPLFARRGRADRGHL